MKWNGFGKEKNYMWVRIPSPASVFLKKDIECLKLSLSLSFFKIHLKYINGHRNPFL